MGFESPPQRSCNNNLSVRRMSAYAPKTGKLSINGTGNGTSIFCGPSKHLVNDILAHAVEQLLSSGSYERWAQLSRFGGTHTRRFD